MFDAGVADRRHDHAGAAGQTRQDGARLVQGIVEVAAMGVQPGLDRLALGRAHVAHLEQSVHEEPKAGMGRQPSGAHMGGAQQTQLSQVLHGVADRSWRQRHAALRQGARPHRIPGLQIALNDAPEDLPGAGVELGKGRTGGEQRLVQGLRRLPVPGVHGRDLDDLG